MAGWLGVLWLVVGCTVPGVGELPGTCQSNADCTGGALCDMSSGICFMPDVEVPASTCSPACAEYEACTRSGCRPRFTGLGIRNPATNSVLTGGTDGGAVNVVAELMVDPLYASTTRFPESLSFSATMDGRPAGTFGAVGRSGDLYLVPWTLPTVQGQVVLTASHPNPAVGLSSTVSVTVDSVPPAFTLSFSAPPVRAIGNVTVADQQDPARGYATAFRRDEAVTVTVAANESVTSVVLTAVGIGPGGAPGQTQSVLLQPAGTCGSSPFCRVGVVNLSTLEMNAFRGTVMFRVEGEDEARNPGSATAGLNVTRWKWAYEGLGSIAGTPAVGSLGTVYIGTSTTTGAGKLVALNPDGSRKWETPIGDVSGSLAVGAFNAGDEHVYAASRTTTAQFLSALRGTDGAEKARCTYSSATEVPGALAVGVTQLQLGTAETGVGIYGGNTARLVGIRPDAPFQNERCIEVSGTSQGTIMASTPGSALVMKDQNIFYAGVGGTVGPRMTSYDLATFSNAPRPGWPQGTGSLTRGIALVGDKLYAGSGNNDNPELGSLFSVPTTGGPISPVYPGNASSRVFNLAIGAGDVAYFGAETATSADLVSLRLGVSGSPMRVAGVDTLRAAPAVGRNDRLYTLNTQGRVSAWVASSLAPLWNVEMQVDLSAKDTSPTLDCQRDAGGAGVTGASTGALYFAGGTKLYAFIVDSPGLDTNAPWPKYQRDARNTGNPATPVTNCP
jgi:hypothetical protein